MHPSNIYRISHSDFAQHTMSLFIVLADLINVLNKTTPPSGCWAQSNLKKLSI